MDARQLANYATHLQPKINVGYFRLITVTTEARRLAADLRDRVGAFWPFLCDDDHKLVYELDIADESDSRFSPIFIPYTFVLDGDRTIHKIYNGWWYVGRPTVEELRMDLRALFSRRPDWEFGKKQ